MDLETLTKQQWKTAKANAGIAKHKGLGQHDASVGKAIDHFIKNRQKFRSSNDDQTIMMYISAAKALRKAMNNFLAAKDFSTQLAQPFQAEITKLVQQINDKVSDLAEAYVEYEKQLKEARAKGYAKMLSY
jgi:hypothetical protein